MNIKNKKGSVFIISYLVVVVLLGLGSAFAIVSANEARSAERQRRTTLAFNIAEAGIERAMYDLRQDFVTIGSTSWSDGTINTYSIGPNTASFYSIPYASTTLNGGSYAVQLKNVAGQTQHIWIQSVGTFGDETETILVYAKMTNNSPWNNAIFAGAGASGAMVNGNVDIRGSVIVLGSGLTSSDYAIDLGGTAELVGNNYTGLSATLSAKVPALPTTSVGGETVSTLNATLRIKQGKVGLSGSSTVGDANVAGNSVKETVDGSYVTDGFAGTGGTSSVHSDNGWSNAYDLGDTVTFPSLSDAYLSYSTYQSYLKANALVISSAADLAKFASITPNSSFSYSGANGSISMDGSGNMAVSGTVYIDGGTLSMATAGSKKTITYTGSGSLLVTGNVQIDVSLVTSGNSSYPTNVVGIMTPGNIGFNQASSDVMGLFYAEGQIKVEKQTDIMGTIVSNYFDMGTNVPSIYQVPDVINHLPTGLIGNSSSWSISTVSWQKQ